MFEASLARTNATEPYIISHLFLQPPIGVIVRVRSTTWLSFQRKRNPLAVSHHLRPGRQMESSHLFYPRSYFASDIFLSLPVTSKAQRCCCPQREHVVCWFCMLIRGYYMHHHWKVYITNNHGYTVNEPSEHFCVSLNLINFVVKSIWL